MAIPPVAATAFAATHPADAPEEGCLGPYCDMYVYNGTKGQNQTQNGQTQESEHKPEPQTSTGGAGAKKGDGKVPLSERDPKRRFTPAESNVLKNRAQGKCDTCGKRTVKSQPYTKGSKHSPREGQAGHKTAWSKGGKTELINGKWQCKGCNQREGANSK